MRCEKQTEDRPRQKQGVLLLEPRREAELGEVEAAQPLRELEGFVGAEKGTSGVDDSICTSVLLKSQSCNPHRLIF